MRRPILFAAAMLALGAMATLGSVQRVDAAPNASWSTGRYVLHCNGDSTSLSIHAELPDGTILANLPVALGPGTFKSKYGTYTNPTNPLNGGDNSPVGYTDDNGNFRARFTPVSDGFGRWYLHGMVGTVVGQRAIVSGGPGTCDFSKDTTYTISGEVFYDDNANGIRDRGERLARAAVLKIGRSGSNGQNGIPFHETRSDFRGRFGWTGLFESAPWPWTICVKDVSEGGKLKVVSAVGATVSGDYDVPQCVIMPPLALGDNHVVIGVQRR